MQEVVDCGKSPAVFSDPMSRPLALGGDARAPNEHKGILFSKLSTFFSLGVFVPNPLWRKGSPGMQIDWPRRW